MASPASPAIMPPTSHRALALDEVPPRTLKQYRLLGQLARGGMAEVFLARADGIGGFERLLVIKRILPELATDTEFVRMFLDEARTAATLHHANIVQVHDVDVADGQVFYVMEHLHGQDVASAMRQLDARGERVPLDSAIAITLAIAAGLHYAHERWGSDGKPLDIVHRDIAPNNVLVTYDGNVKLIDFGIAKAANNLSRTKFGLFKGKLPYASPEQCRCEPIDRRSDVFSLGVVLYELTTGQRLFTADNEFEMIKVVSEAVVPRPRLRDKAYPRELEAIVLKALAHDRGERYATAQALQADLEAFAQRRQLDLSAMSLARLMERVFDDELLRWRDAQRAGLTLEEHITHTSAHAIDTRSAAPRHGQPAAFGDIDPPRVPPREALGEPATDHEITYPLGLPGRVLDIEAHALAFEAQPIAPRAEPPDAERDAPARLPGAARFGLIAIAAAGLVGSGALGALWLTARNTPDRPTVPTREMAAKGLEDSAAANPPDQAADSTPDQAAASQRVIQLPDTSDETAAHPAPVTDEPRRERATPAHPTRKTARGRARTAPAVERDAGATTAPAAAPPAAAAAPRPRPVLDDSTLDEVAPRSKKTP